jgi:hypothetical protein
MDRLALIYIDNRELEVEGENAGSSTKVTGGLPWRR